MSADISPIAGAEPPWVAQALDFWFREVGPNLWFVSSNELDQQVRAQYLELHEQIVKTDAHGLAGARPLLAVIVMLDQFSRNMFRGTPRAFASDKVARRVAQQVIDLGLDASMDSEERYFVYLPFEHSEDREHQALAVRLIEQLGNDNWTSYARARRLIIDRFGRFPHRNIILGRTSSQDEQAFLNESMGSF